MDTFLDNFYKGKTVFITGHTGFKGAWLCMLLHRLGSHVCGYSLQPPTNPSLYIEAHLDDFVNSEIGDIRNLRGLQDALSNAMPDIVIHMAAQPLVRESYINPVDTYQTNVMGTVNLLEACRYVSSIRSIVNVTTDKCYENKEWYWGYREGEPMGGYDPYSNSKGCSELVTSSYRNSFFNPLEYDRHRVAVASARAGNVIGGGDWAKDRLIPDFIRAINEGKEVLIRNPRATRPWQHVLEPLTGYLTLAKALYTDGCDFAEGWNFGPDDSDVQDVEWIVSSICQLWGGSASYTLDNSVQPHEAKYLKLDCSKAKSKLGWYPRWDLIKTLKSIVEWNKSHLANENLLEISLKQIEDYVFA